MPRAHPLPQGHFSTLDGQTVPRAQSGAGRTLSMDPFWKTCCSSHTTQYSFRVGIRCSAYFMICREEAWRSRVRKKPQHQPPCTPAPPAVPGCAKSHARWVLCHQANGRSRLHWLCPVPPAVLATKLGRVHLHPMELHPSCRSYTLMHLAPIGQPLPYPHIPELEGPAAEQA